MIIQIIKKLHIFYVVMAKAVKNDLGKLIFDNESAGRAVLRAKREHWNLIYKKGELEIGTPLDLEKYLSNHKSWEYIKECYRKVGKPDGPYVLFKNESEMRNYENNL